MLIIEKIEISENRMIVETGTDLEGELTELIDELGDEITADSILELIYTTAGIDLS